MRLISTISFVLLAVGLSACFPAKPLGDETAAPEADADADADSDTDTDIESHGDGWDHGLAAKLQREDCTVCHGEDLGGGSSGVSCDSCHPAGWRSDCTFCHGGTENDSGAPPLDIDGSASGISFPEHSVHLEGDHPRWSCEQCHLVPADVLSVGHIFIGDETAAVAELTMAAGLSSQGGYGGGGSCSNLYCHGDGDGSRGSATSGQRYDCGDCHGDASSARSLSGEHDEHLDEGVRCGDCHADTVSGNSTITGPDLHVNGRVDVEIDELNYDGNSCDGSCHGEGHSNERWEGGDDDDD
jgi:predicted CxxxxCH...CXXCH cytochrome family protein